MDGSYLDNADRLETLRATGLLDSLPEAAFDRYVRLAATITGAPIALISLVDAQRQFFKAQLGLAEPWAGLRQTPLTHSFCQHVVTSGETLAIEQASSHPLVRENLAITELGVESYLGAPLQLEGQRLGSLCVIDGKTRQWTATDRQALQDLADAVNTEIELRRRNQQLRVERDNALRMSDTLSEFLGRAGHELRTPLQGILLSVEMAGGSQGLDPKGRRLLEGAYGSAQSMRRLLDDILQLHRLNRGLQQTSLSEVFLEERFRWMKTELATPGRRLEMTVAENVDPRLRLDWGKTHQILVHLISNALRHTSGSVEVSARREANTLVIEVKDEGVGLTSEQARTAFEPFGRLQEKDGVGLGLPISARLAEVMGGSLRLAGQPGQGSVFRLSLPYDVAPAGEGRESVGVIESRRVLVVDDHELNLELFEALLTSLGQEVDTASSGPEALELLASRPYELVLLDLHMPGLSGYETLARISRKEGMKVVATSAGSLTETDQRCREAGFDALLPKPVSRLDLMRLLSE